MNKKTKVKNSIYQLLLGVFAGFINGFFGGGGGTVVVVMLIALLKKQQRIAHATAILIILPLCVVSAIVYSVFGNFDFNVGIGCMIGVFCGGIVGAFVLKKISSKWLGVIFSVVMMIAGVKILFF